MKLFRRQSMALRTAIAATLFLMFACSIASAGILGDTVKIDYLYPDSSTSYGLSTTGVVTGAGLGLDLFGLQQVTAYSDHVDIVAITSSFWIATAFNGVSVTDLTNPGIFTSALADAASTDPGFDNSRVWVTGGVLFINMEGISTVTGGLARTDFTTGTPTPEPGSLLLLGSGFLGVLGTMRRKLSL